MSFVERFLAEGCLTVDQLFDPAMIGRAHGEYRRQYDAIDFESLPPHLRHVGERRLQLPIRLSGPLLDPALYAHPVLLAMLSGLLGPEMVIDSFTCVSAFPGADEQQLHRDHPGLFSRAEQAGPSPPFAITVAIPLVDLTPETGTTILFPGSVAAEIGADEAPVALGPPHHPYFGRGGCFLMDYRLWHRGMANRSAAPRPILYIVYARHWFTDMINYRKHARITLDEADLPAIPIAHRLLFARLAAKGGFDKSQVELCGPPAGSGQSAS